MALSEIEKVLLQSATHAVHALDRTADDPLHDGGRAILNSTYGAGSQQRARVSLAVGVDADGYENLYVALANASRLIGGATVALTGTFTDPEAEADVLTGGLTLILTLTGAEWVADIASDPAKAKQLIRRLRADGSAAAGWNQAIVPTMLSQVDGVVSGGNPVARTSNTVVTITTPTSAQQTEEGATYSIASDEELDFVIPSWAYTQGPAGDEVPGIPASLAAGAAKFNRTIQAA